MQCSIKSADFEICFALNIVNAAFAYSYLDSAPFGYAFATQRSLLSAGQRWSFLLKQASGAAVFRRKTKVFLWRIFPCLFAQKVVY
jgi:hypothetical protein